MWLVIVVVREVYTMAALLTTLQLWDDCNSDNDYHCDYLVLCEIPQVYAVPVAAITYSALLSPLPLFSSDHTIHCTKGCEPCGKYLLESDNEKYFYFLYCYVSMYIILYL